jgi:hypothetical protein
MNNTKTLFVTPNEKLLCIKGTEHLFSVCHKISDFVTETVAENIEEQTAHLFAAAPDLLSALERLANDYAALMNSQGAAIDIGQPGSEFTAGQWVGARLGSPVHEAWKAIAKAKGEA